MKTTSKNKFSRITVLVLLLIVVGIAGVSAQPRNLAQNVLLPSFLRGNDYHYSGFEMSMSVRNMVIDSDIPELQQLVVRQVGANVGGVWGNSFLKVRPRVGLFYSDGSVPYTIDMAEFAVAGNFYLLKKFNKRERRVEPYLVGNVAYQGTKFFGNYLDKDVRANYSVSEEKMLGRVDAVRATAGIGGEIQLWSAAGQFIHFYSEVLTGASIHTMGSNNSFGDTFSRRPLRLTIGVAVGFGK